MAQKRLKARDLVEACLDRINAREGQVHAWEALDPDGARKRADMLDKRASPAGPLHGIPLAVKDIISTKTMPTTCGSPIYRDHVVGKDAACVTQLVNAGAIVLGKAVTTEFAGGHAGKTHNPHNLRHTPAGSSLGLGGGGRRLHGAHRLRHADRGLGDPAGRLQRRRGLQGHLRLGRHDRHRRPMRIASTRWASSRVRPTTWR